MSALLSVLFVCTGNICRSPSAQAVFSRLLSENDLRASIKVSSCGTHSYHIGEPPDHRAQDVARKRGYDMAGYAAQAFTLADFDRYDYLIAMDDSHLDFLQRRLAQTHRPKTSASGGKAAPIIKKLLDYSAQYHGQDVPDPYYGVLTDFTHMLDLLEEGCQGFLQFLIREHNVLRA